MSSLQNLSSSWESAYHSPRELRKLPPQLEADAPPPRQSVFHTPDDMNSDMVGGTKSNNASGSEAATKPLLDFDLGKQPATALPTQSLTSVKNVHNKRITELLNAVQVVGTDFHSDIITKANHVINLFQSYVENGHPLEELVRNVVPAGKIVYEYLILQKGTPLTAARAALESYLLTVPVTTTRPRSR